MERRYFHLNVFTDKPEGGNPLAVMTDTAGLDDETMQALASRIGLSETVFVFEPRGAAHLASIRIFTPKFELPFAGHPTIGTAICLTNERLWLPREEEFEALAVLEAKGGILRVGVKPGNGRAPFAEFDVPKNPVESGDAAPVDRIAAALGLAPNEIGFENFTPRCFSAGFPFTFVPIRGLDAMERAQIVEEHWAEAFGDTTHNDAYLYCRETVERRCAFHARLFAPGMGVAEDPATGSAAAAFAGVIKLFDRPPEGRYNCIIEQGIEMGQPSQIFLEFEIANRMIRVVRIGGYAVSIGEKTVTL
jgi:trans-2,3-dihydro-3-hydroxyanthranilate isomerase